MDDEAHIGLVYAHAEGYGRHDYVYALHEKIVLCLRACCRVETSVIRCRLYLVGFEHGGQLLHGLS